MKKIFTFFILVVFTNITVGFGQTALNFDGSNDIVPTPYIPVFNNHDFTIEAWIFVSSSSNDDVIFSMSHADLDNQTIEFKITSGGIITVWHWYNNFDFGTVPVGQWVHVAYAYTNSTTTGEVFVNGVSLGTHNWGAPLAVSSNTLFGGIGYGYSGREFNGSIDEVRIWGDVRTSTEIMDNMNTHVCGSADLKAIYLFENGTACGNNNGVTTAIDETGSYDGVITNFTLNGSCTSNFTNGVAGECCDPLNITATPGTTVCPNSDVTLTATSVNGGNITWTGGVTNAVPFNIAATSTYTATSDNSYDCSATVVTITVEDLLAPVPDVATLSDVTGECSATVATVPTATDACAGVITGTTSDPLYYDAVGTYSITWTYDDGNGNTSTQNQTVTVTDNNAPVPDVANIDVIAQCMVDLTTYTPTATDACMGTIEGYTFDDLIFTEQGVYTVTWGYEDGNGNLEIQYQTITIEDTYTPTITPPDAVTYSADEFTCDVELSQTVVYDITYSNTMNMILSGPECNGTIDLWVCDVTATIMWTSTVSAPVESVSIEYYQTWNNGGTYTTTFNGVVENDYVGPIVNCENSFVTQTLTPNNYNSGGLNMLDIETPMGYCLVFDQNAGWDAGVYAKVTVVYSGDETLTPPIVTDNCNVASLTNDAPQFLPLGETVVTWTATDDAGNMTTAEQIVTVADVTAPVLDVATLDYLTGECSVDAPATPTATDACMGVINGVADVTFPYTIQGTYTVTWTYDDGNGNVAMQYQTIILNDEIAPDMPTLTMLTDQCSVIVEAPTTTDNCAGTVTGTTSDPTEYTEQGVYTITWTFTDENGNSVDAEQLVVIEDTYTPTITCVENQIIDLTEGQTTYSVTGTEFDAIADDNCTVASFDNDLNMTSTLAGEELMAGTYSVTWTVMDAAGNMEICTMEIVVNPYVGLQSIDNINVSVYPNPTSGVLNITNAEGYKVVITDVSGRTIQTVEANTDNLKVDLSNNADGMYFIQFINNGVVSTVKIIKK